MQENESRARGVLFVCTGNICRSPMAAALFARSNGRDLIVRSAGLRSVDGQAAHPLAQEEMRRRGIDLSTHRARTVTPNLLAAFQLILVMEAQHRAWIQAKMPSVDGRVHLLGRWRDLEIFDPVNGGQSDFQRTVEEIEECLADWLPVTEAQFDAVGTKSAEPLGERPDARLFGSGAR